jgi:hypothetical protein
MSNHPQGQALLDNPALNKGTAFSAEERRIFRLEGLLPCAVENLDRQAERAIRHLEAKPTDLERYIYLIGLSDRNETLFYRVVMSDPARFIPILYDPTVADACLALCFDRGPHPRSWRYRRQRHGHSDRQVAALYRVRGGTARPYPAGSAGYRHDQRAAYGWNALLPAVPAAGFAIVGAAAFLASAMAMPLTAIVLTIEFTRIGHDMWVPVLFAVAGSVTAANARARSRTPKFANVPSATAAVVGMEKGST